MVLGDGDVGGEGGAAGGGGRRGGEAGSGRGGGRHDGTGEQIAGHRDGAGGGGRHGSEASGGHGGQTGGGRRDGASGQIAGHGDGAGGAAAHAGTAGIRARDPGSPLLSPAPHPPTSPTSPASGHLRELTAACIHCGFCLPACPTYALTGDENDSPRGRIHLLRQVVTGQAVLDAAVAEHVDSCLGCLACVSACPSGVEYDRIIEEARPVVEDAYADARGDRRFRRLIFLVFPHPLVLRIAAFVGVGYRRTGGSWVVRVSGLLRRFPRAAAVEALMPRTTVREAMRRVPKRSAARGERRASVGVVTGCVQRVFFSAVNAATVRVLTAEGCDVTAPRQGCCGALSLHAGRAEEARGYARRMIDAFRAAEGGERRFGRRRFGGQRFDAVVVNVAGCGSTLKEYGALLADDPAYAAAAADFAARVRDVTEFLAGLPPRAPRHPVPARVAYHDACHLGHGQGVRSQPRQVLRDIPGLELVEPAEGNLCCGSAGIHNLVRPEAAEALGRRKAERILATAPDLVATGNPGCLLQIQRYLKLSGRPVPVRHPIELVDASIRGGLAAGGQREGQPGPRLKPSAAAASQPATTRPAGST